MQLVHEQMSPSTMPFIIQISDLMSTFSQGVTSLSGEAGGANKSPNCFHFDVKVLRKLPKVNWHKCVMSQKSMKLIVMERLLT